MKRIWFAVQGLDEKTQTWKHMGIHQGNLKNAQSELRRIKRMTKGRIVLRIETQSERRREYEKDQKRS